MQRIMQFLKIFYVVTMCLLFISCSYLQKWTDKVQGKNQIEGEGSEDISNVDIDSSNVGSDSGNIQGLSTVFFALDSSQLSLKTKQQLKNNKQWFDNNPKVKRIEIEGHCDSLGSESYNIGLGQRRAEQVMNYLKSIGVKADLMSVISYGEEKPISQTNTSLNRRVNFVPIY